MTRRWKRRLTAASLLLVSAGAILVPTLWYKVYREVPQVFGSADEKWKYGSLGGEADRGIPYWIWVVMPRMFGDKLPGPGGWKSFGLAWEEGAELPIGFSLKTVGFPRITNNCALCHTSGYRTKPDEVPTYVAAGGSQTINIGGLLRFFSEAAADPRFNADTILGEIDLVHELDVVDRLLYRFAIIPMIREKLLEQGKQLAWIDAPDRPDWGPGRDDPFNLLKYHMTSVPVDRSVAPTDFPAIWSLKSREGRPLNTAGETPGIRSVVIDSAIGVGCGPAGGKFEKMVSEIASFVSNAPAPTWPYREGEHALKPELGSAGAKIYLARCAECHEPGAAKTGMPADMAELGTDRERLDSWTQAAADQFNEVMKKNGYDRPPVVKTQAYIAPTLEGVWLRAPYLHNGSVANMRELLTAPDARRKEFYRGYDVYDAANLGFVIEGLEAKRVGFRFDASLKGNSNAGHGYGTDLAEGQKTALLEFLKTK